MAFSGPRHVRSSSSKSLRTSLTSFRDAAAAALPVSGLPPVFHSSCLAGCLLRSRLPATLRHLAPGSPSLNRTVQIQSRPARALSLPSVSAAMKPPDASCLDLSTCAQVISGLRAERVLAECDPGDTRCTRSLQSLRCCSLPTWRALLIGLPAIFSVSSCRGLRVLGCPRELAAWSFLMVLGYWRLHCGQWMREIAATVYYIMTGGNQWRYTSWT